MKSTLKYNWLAIYTKPRSEKKAFVQLQGAGIETYLPLVKTLKQWSDRKKWVEEPLFRSYVFVRVSEKEYYDALNATPHTVRYVTFEGKAVPIPPVQIEAMKNYIAQGDHTDMELADFEPGQEVEVIQGAMKGLRGRLVRAAGKHKVRVEIDGIGKELFIEVPANLLRKV
jgi:transcription antitermination factor NusG